MRRTINPKFLAFLLALVFVLSHSYGRADVTYQYDAQGRLTKVTYGDSMSISYTYEANSNIVAIEVEGNAAPAAFHRLMPEDSTVVQADSVQFVWSQAVDPNADPVDYTLSVQVPDIDTSFVTQDTSFTVAFGELVSSEQAFEVTWSVIGSDGQLSTEPTNGPGFFTLDLATSVAGPESNAIPEEFALSQNYPNPFNPSTQIKYQLPVAAEVEIAVYNLLGEKVRTLVNAKKPAGDHNVTWDGTNDRGRQVATGVYLYRLRAEAANQNDFVETQKMLLMK